MARKKDDGSLIGLLFCFAASLFVLVYLLSNIGYLVAWAYFELKCKNLGNAYSFADFDFTLAEKEELNHSENSLSQIAQLISNIFDEGRHLSTRQDGFFHARSKLGKELNAQLEKYLPERLRWQSQVEYLKELPTKRMSKWIFNNSMKNAFRLGAPVYAVSVVFFSRYYVPGWVVNFGIWMKESSIIKLFNMPSIYYGALFPSIVITFIFSALIFFKSSLTYNEKFM